MNCVHNTWELKEKMNEREKEEKDGAMFLLHIGDIL